MENMKKNYKRNGFTLIELLAVIVILALLVLVATPAVTRIMQNAQKNSFKNEVVGMVSYMEDAFTEKMSGNVKSGTIAADGNVYNVTIGSKGYLYLCMTLDQLVNQQYMKKNLGDSYKGYIQMFVPDGNGATTTYVNVTNGKFYLQGQMSDVSDSSHLASQTKATGTGASDPTAGCPTSVTSIPSAKNVQS